MISRSIPRQQEIAENSRDPRPQTMPMYVINSLSRIGLLLKHKTQLPPPPSPFRGTSARNAAAPRPPVDIVPPPPTIAEKTKEEVEREMLLGEQRIRHAQMRSFIRKDAGYPMTVSPTELRRSGHWEKIVSNLCATDWARAIGWDQLIYRHTLEWHMSKVCHNDSRKLRSNQYIASGATGQRTKGRPPKTREQDPNLEVPIFQPPPPSKPLQLQQKTPSTPQPTQLPSRRGPEETDAVGAGGAGRSRNRALLQPVPGSTSKNVQQQQDPLQKKQREAASLNGDTAAFPENYKLAVTLAGKSVWASTGDSWTRFLSTLQRFFDVQLPSTTVIYIHHRGELAALDEAYYESDFFRDMKSGAVKPSTENRSFVFHVRDGPDNEMLGMPQQAKRIGWMDLAGMVRAIPHPIGVSVPPPLTQTANKESVGTKQTAVDDVPGGTQDVDDSTEFHIETETHPPDPEKRDKPPKPATNTIKKKPAPLKLSGALPSTAGTAKPTPPPPRKVRSSLLPPANSPKPSQPHTPHPPLVQPPPQPATAPMAKDKGKPSKPSGKASTKPKPKSPKSKPVGKPKPAPAKSSKKAPEKPPARPPTIKAPARRRSEHDITLFLKDPTDEDAISVPHYFKFTSMWDEVVSSLQRNFTGRLPLDANVEYQHDDEYIAIAGQDEWRQIVEYMRQLQSPERSLTIRVTVRFSIPQC